MSNDKKIAVTLASAVIGAVGGGALSMIMLIIFWGYYEMSIAGVFIGLPVGLISATAISIWQIRKQVPASKVGGVSSLLAILIACIFTAVFVSVW